MFGMSEILQQERQAKGASKKQAFRRAKFCLHFVNTLLTPEKKSEPAPFV